METDVVNDENRSSATQSLKVSCGDPEKLQQISNIICSDIGIQAPLCMPEEIAEKFSNRFQEVFSKIMQDNIEINGMRLDNCLNQSLNSMKQEEKNNIINEKYLPTMGNLLTKVTDQRKRLPPKITHLVQKRLKQEVQNIKIFTPIIPDIKKLPDTPNKNSEEQWFLTKDEFKEFCQKLNSSNQVLQTEIDVLEKVKYEIQFAENVFNHEKNRTYGLLSENCSSNSSSTST